MSNLLFPRQPLHEFLVQNEPLFDPDDWRGDTEELASLDTEEYPACVSCGAALDHNDTSYNLCPGCRRDGDLGGI